MLCVYECWSEPSVTKELINSIRYGPKKKDCSLLKCVTAGCLARHPTLVVQL